MNKEKMWYGIAIGATVGSALLGALGFVAEHNCSNYADKKQYETFKKLYLEEKENEEAE